MKKIIYLSLLVATVILYSCSNGPKRTPGRTYMPDMAYSRAYESYPNLDKDVFTDQDSLAGNKIYYDRKPVAGTVKRGQMGAYLGTNDSIGLNYAKTYVNPLVDSMMTKEMMTESERLYNIYCGICHGDKLDGQGPLVASGKYSVAAANLMDAKFTKAQYSDGQIFHTLTYGKGQMGSYASQLNNKQRWMVVNYIRNKQKPADAAVVKVTGKTPDTAKATTMKTGG
jgi:mono/diheme cytochrome c family protein